MIVPWYNCEHPKVRVFRFLESTTRITGPRKNGRPPNEVTSTVWRWLVATSAGHIGPFQSPSRKATDNGRSVLLSSFIGWEPYRPRLPSNAHTQRIRRWRGHNRHYSLSLTCRTKIIKMRLTMNNLKGRRSLLRMRRFGIAFSLVYQPIGGITVIYDSFNSPRHWWEAHNRMYCIDILSGLSPVFYLAHIPLHYLLPQCYYYIYFCFVQ